MKEHIHNGIFITLNIANKVKKKNENTSDDHHTTPSPSRLRPTLPALAIYECPSTTIHCVCMCVCQNQDFSQCNTTEYRQVSTMFRPCAFPMHVYSSTCWSIHNQRWQLRYRSWLNGNWDPPPVLSNFKGSTRILINNTVILFLFYNYSLLKFPCYSSLLCYLPVFSFLSILPSSTSLSFLHKHPLNINNIIPDLYTCPKF